MWERESTSSRGAGPVGWCSGPGRSSNAQPVGLPVPDGTLDVVRVRELALQDALEEGRQLRVAREAQRDPLRELQALGVRSPRGAEQALEAELHLETDHAVLHELRAAAARGPHEDEREAGERAPGAPEPGGAECEDRPVAGVDQEHEPGGDVVGGRIRAVVLEGLRADGGRAHRIVSERRTRVTEGTQSGSVLAVTPHAAPAAVA